MNIIDTPQLRARIAAGQRLWLVHAAEAVPFRFAHLPGAVGFADADQAAAFLRSDDTIVVYGLDPTCRTSRTVAADLTRDGFGHVAWYAGGLEDWLATGGHVDGTRDPHHHLAGASKSARSPCRSTCPTSAQALGC